jgi:hypothetical protein
LDVHRTNALRIGQHLPGNNCGIIAVPRKGIAEAALQAGQRRGPRIARNRLAPLMKKSAQIIDAMAMVGMIVRSDNGIERPNITGETLATQIGRSVDQYREAPGFDYDRHAAAAIARIIGVTVAPIIANSGHTR